MEHVVFLRGINVGGIKVPMADLRRCLADLGLADLRTYLQTGNVVFSSDRTAAQLRPDIEDALTATFGYQAHVLMSTPAELRIIIAAHPFPARQDRHRYVVLCNSTTVAAELLAAAESARAGSTSTGESGDDLVAGGGRVVHWSTPKGSTLSTPFGKVLARQRFRTTTTTATSTPWKRCSEPEHGA